MWLQFRGILKGLKKLIFNRIFYLVLAILFQLGGIYLLFGRMASFSPLIYSLLTILSLATVLYVCSRDINPSYRLGWTIVIMALPIFGALTYVLVGQSKLLSDVRWRFNRVKEDTKDYLEGKPEIAEGLAEADSHAARQSRYIAESSGYPLHDQTTATFFQIGDEMFPALARDLREAKHFIFIEYFIINDGVMWRTILDILEQKVSEGVDVRIIYDDFGCIRTLPINYYKTLQDKGIRCEVFNPFRFWVNFVQNNRDHRKLCIIDGYTGFTGGINLSDEYINKKERFGFWKDTAVRLHGEAVWNMTMMFLHMWEVVTKTPSYIPYESYMPHRYHPEPFPSDGYVHPFGDSPLDDEPIGENVYLNIIGNARKYVYICTPYLIIDDEMMNALKLAARGGVDVRIMTPGIPDKKIVYLLTQSYYEPLIEAGVQILTYQPGFLHAKSFVSDDRVAVLGTINLDYRSLYLHFEDGVWFYDNGVVSDIRDDFLISEKDCLEVDLAAAKSRTLPVRLMQSLLRLIAPIL